MEQNPGFLDKIFHLSENKTSVRTEIMAGIILMILTFFLVKYRKWQEVS